MYYTYLWLREDGTPYYVGKGFGNRAYVKHSHKFPPPTKEQIVVYPAVSEAEAFEAEIALIWYYGRKDLGLGCLRNLTSGGEGRTEWFTDDQIINAYNSSSDYVQAADKLGMKPSPFGKRCRALGLKAKGRIYKRSVAMCHPLRKHYGKGLCHGCYLVKYKNDNRDTINSYKREWNKTQKTQKRTQ